jgi:hypothetical protein
MSSLSCVGVLDLSRVFSGPWVAQMLADFGAGAGPLCAATSCGGLAARTLRTARTLF